MTDLLKPKEFYEAETAKAVETAVKKKRTRPEQTPQTDAGDNTKFLLHGLQFFDLPKVNMNDVEDVKQRTIEYFRACAENDMKAGMVAYAGALGYSRSEVHKIMTGQTKHPVEVRDTLKKAKSLIEQQYESYMSNNKINAVAGIFLMKNNFEDYTEKQEVEIKAVPLLGEEQNPEKIAERYMEALPPVD